ncbi:hypothetical protein L21SP5_01468 [Salinivirga cyanobacteriivorans]|uniref:Phage shock protein B n=1 Tax=Salinivirga cyanobacteriivorans TaxID=1307839 RepID=A0A0S2HYM7_9BACT|nr:hypothetical protein [Salinivirga cyanobacteriivorans]ALO15118.1 hypothetical protein L21SP5_01468 [Salinivirga cyanobacteriivorans]
MQITYILIGLGVIFVLVVFLLFEIYRLKRKLRQAEIDTLQQINLTIKSLDTEVQQLKKDVYKTIDEQ